MTKLLNTGYKLLQNFVALPYRFVLLGRVKKNNKGQTATIPNAISLVRVVLAIIIQFVTGFSTAANAIAAYSDLVDGVLAKEIFGATRSGAFIDPACDKIYIAAYAWLHRSEFNTPSALF